MQTKFDESREVRDFSANLHEISLETKYRAIYRASYCSCLVRNIIAVLRDIVTSQRDIITAQRDMYLKCDRINILQIKTNLYMNGCETKQCNETQMENIHKDTRVVVEIKVFFTSSPNTLMNRFPLKKEKRHIKKTQQN